MNCKGFQDCLSQGGSLTEAARAHLASCPECRKLMEAFDELESQAPSPLQLERIAQQLTSSWKPVRPLPSNKRLILFSFVLFVAYSVAAAGFTLGYQGFKILDLNQILVYFGLLSGLAILFSVMIVEQAIPGSRRSFASKTVIVISLSLIAVVASLLYRSFDLTKFVHEGIPCLISGTTCAFVYGLVASVLLRKFLLTTPTETIVATGFFAGLTGVAALALLCPIQNSAHVIVWHLGAMMAGGIGGAIVGVLRNVRIQSLNTENVSRS